MDRTAENILRILQERGISKKAFAEGIGVRAQTITDWQNGKTKSYNRYMPEIARFFDMSVDDIINYPNKSGKINTNNIELPTDEQIAYAFWGGAEGITSEMLDEVRQYAQMVKMREDAKSKK